MASLCRPPFFSKLPAPRKSLRIVAPCSCAAPYARQQQRDASTAKRHRKLLNVGPAPFFGGPTDAPTGGSGRSRQPKRDSLPEFDHIVFNPPSSSPNVYHTPAKFLPENDPRRQLQLGPRAQSERIDMTTDALGIGSTSANTAKVGTPSDESTFGVGGGEYWKELPPPVRTPYTKSYHLGEKEIEEIRRLRTEDEEYWTRPRLAEKFQCSQLFVGMIVQASKQRLQRLQEEREAKEKSWGRRTRLAREERAKRKAMLERDE